MTIKTNNRFATKTVLASAISTALLAVAMPSQAESSTELAKESDVIAELRVRGENVQEDNTKDDAMAMTARARLGYETASMAGFKVLAEYDQVVILQDEYNSASSTGPNKANTSVIADGRGGDFNRAQISYTHDMAKATLGRQRIILDNARFVGNVGWRQNEQTFDAVRIDLTAVENLSATYAYVSQRNTINYQDIAVKDHLLNVGYTTPVGKISTYAYMLENDDTGKTNDTFGLRFKGKAAAGDSVDILYTAEFADQSHNNADLSYIFAEAGAKFSAVTVLAGYENLGSGKGTGDADFSFVTPYATGHAFNGWADKFLSTPEIGLNDIYTKVIGNVAGVKLVAAYHDFNSDKDSVDLGSEIDLLASMSFNQHMSAGIKYANYSQGDDNPLLVDTQKFWLWGEAKF